MSDVKKLLPIGRDIFEKESPYGDTHTFDEMRTAKLILDLLNLGKDNAIILLAEDDTGKIVGILAAIKTFTTMGFEPTAMEVIWWVAQDARKSRLQLQLIHAFHYWCNRVGVSRIVLSSMENEHSQSVDRFYKRLGYKLTEHTYVKKVT